MEVALHGFLGLPSDFENGFDLFASPILPFWEWAEWFNERTSACDTLVGYSMGGRLALHALLQKPEAWKQATLISTHPGLIVAGDRYEQDLKWAKRFEKDPWDVLIQDWNDQSVFDVPLQRDEKDFSRDVLAKTLRTWSLGLQEDLRTRIAELDIPITWITGDRDTKFCEIADSVTLKHPLSNKKVIPGDHRINLI